MACSNFSREIGSYASTCNSASRSCPSSLVSNPSSYWPVVSSRKRAGTTNILRIPFRSLSTVGNLMSYSIIKGKRAVLFKSTHVPLVSFQSKAAKSLLLSSMWGLSFQLALTQVSPFNHFQSLSLALIIRV